MADAAYPEHMESIYRDEACLAYMRREIAEAERRAAILAAVREMPVVPWKPAVLLARV